jgi:hypothetical protein
LSNFGLKPKSSSDTTVIVTVGIEKTTEKTVNFDNSNIVLNGKNIQKYDYSVVQESGMIISGRQQDIDVADTSKIKAICDVSELGEGIHSVVATISDVSDLKVKVDEIPVFTVTITAKETEEPIESNVVTEVTESVSAEEEVTTAVE